MLNDAALLKWFDCNRGKNKGGEYRSVKSFDTKFIIKREITDLDLSERVADFLPFEKNLAERTYYWHHSDYITLYILIAEDRVPDTGRGLSAFFVILTMETGIHELWNPMYTVGACICVRFIV